MKRLLIPLLNRLPYIRTLRKLLTDYEAVSAYPPGHYYSPVPDAAELSGRQWQATSLPVAIRWDEQEQLTRFSELASKYSAFPYKTSGKSESYDFRIPDSFFTISDVFHTWAILQELRPKRIVEVGSGYSSVFFLDYFFHQQADGIFTSIDPDPSRFNSLKKKAISTFTQIQKPVQEVELSVFAKLKANDILFIDSSHVTKAGSDLNYLMFEVLPVLQSGVYIHVHDCDYPLEYTKELIEEKKYAWNEAYLWKAFLMHNQDYTIWYFPDFIWSKHPEEYRKLLPEISGDRPSSLWIKKR